MRVNFQRPVLNEILDRKGLGNEKLANGVLCILDGWAANREANFMTAKLVLNFCADFRSSEGKLTFDL